MDFKEAMSTNSALLMRARRLNTRAGKEIFPVPSREKLTKIFAVALEGARRIAEIRDVSALLLPPLDEQMIEKVLREQPDTITVLGEKVVVEYRSEYAPRIRLDFRGDDSRKWLQLPDDGIHLPGGREVAMYAAVEGYGYYIEALSSQFKVKVCECLNQGLWDNWRKPELPTPTDSILPITEVEYGQCVVTNTPLLAYGTVRYDSWNGLWISYWSRSMADTKQMHEQTCIKFVEVKEKAVRDALNKRIRELYGTSCNRRLPEEMHEHLRLTVYGYEGGATTVAEMEALIAEVEAVMATIAEQKAEAERKQREAEARHEAVNTALSNMGCEAHIWIPEGGEIAYVLAGKTSKLGSLEVTPDAGASTCDGPYCFGNFKYRNWVPFKLGVKSQARDYSSGGNLQSEILLFVPSGLLTTGVYGVGSDNEGQYFFPVIYHNGEGVEIIPEVSEIRKTRVPAASQEKKSTAEKIDLSQLFAGRTGAMK